MTTPSFIFALLLASTFGLLFHVLLGGSLMRMFFYVLVACVAFLAGHLIGEWFGWQAIQVANINMATALPATIIGLITASILAGPGKDRRR